MLVERRRATFRVRLGRTLPRLLRRFARVEVNLEVDHPVVGGLGIAARGIRLRGGGQGRFPRPERPAPD
jgi:hypothetical protein